MHFRVFFKGHGTELGYFSGLLKFQIFFLECLKFLIFFGVNGRCWVRAYVCEKIKSTPPPWGKDSHSVYSAHLHVVQ